MCLAFNTTHEQNPVLMMWMQHADARTQTTGLTGIGLTILGQKNVIVRNMKISKVQADYGDGITVQASSNVWIDSCDISADVDHGKDYYDGLIDVVHASEWVTISNTYLHDHVRSPSRQNCWVLDPLSPCLMMLTVGTVERVARRPFQQERR